MSSASPTHEPFRDDELRVQITALREQRDALVKQRDARLAELRHLRRWRWGRFLAAYFGPLAALLLAVLAWAVLAMSWR
jgi:hypothetical protein